VRTLTNDQARRLSLAAQGFARPRPTGPVDKRHLRRAMEHMQVLQLDSVNVCVRSHYVPLFSRLGPYDRALIDALAYDDRAFYEYWGHEASFVPVGLYPAFAWRREHGREYRAVKRLRAEQPGYMEAVEDQVVREGPLTVKDLDDGGESTGPWWGLSKGKLALEGLFARGRVCIDRRVHFARRYAAPDRVLPPAILALPPLSKEEGWRVLARSALGALGVGTLKDVADYWRIRAPDLRPALAELVERGDVEPVEVRGWARPAFALPGYRVPCRIAARALLTPFDPVVWNRERAERLHGFAYKIEIYVPKEKRRYGYYVYPFLLGDRLVARVDLKADRAGGRLLVRAAWIEAGQDPDRVAPELAAELRTFAGWLGLSEVQIEPRGDLHAPLALQFEGPFDAADHL
jgi:uncharacterized protein